MDPSSYQITKSVPPSFCTQFKVCYHHKKKRGQGVTPLGQPAPLLPQRRMLATAVSGNIEVLS